MAEFHVTPSGTIEIDLSDLLHHGISVDIDDDEIKEAIGEMDTDDILDQIDNSEVATHVEEQGAHEFASHFTTEFVMGLFKELPELKQLILGAEMDLPNPASMTGATTEWLENGGDREGRKDLAAALDLLVAKNRGRLAIQDALSRYHVKQARKAEAGA